MKGGVSMVKVYADSIEKGLLTVDEFLAKKISQAMKEKVLVELGARGFEY